MAAELRVDTIKSRSGINTFSFTGDSGFTFDTNTGIGTTNPTSKLHVDGTALITGVSTFGGNVVIPDFITHTGDTNTRFGFESADTFTVETGGSERLRINSGGNFLLNGGTIFGDDSAANTLTIQSTSGNANHSKILIGIGEGSDNGGIHMYTAGSSVAERRITIKGTSGDVGIGTNTPDCKLEISEDGYAFPSPAGSSHLRVGNGGGSATIDIAAANTQIAGVYFSDTDATARGVVAYHHNGDYLYFGTNDATERLRITSTGDVVLGQGSTVGSSAGVVTYFGDGSNLTGIAAGGSGTFDTGITTSIIVPVTAGIGTNDDKNRDVFVGPGIAYSFPSTASTQYVIESIHVVNKSGGNLYLSGRHDINGGANVPIANRVAVPYQGAVELLEQPHVANLSDIIRLQALTGTGTSATGANNGLDAFITYSAKSDSTDYIGVAQTITSTDQEFFEVASNPCVVQSLNLVNYSNNVDVDVSISIFSGGTTGGIATTGIRRGYLAYNLTVPRNSTIELCEKPKRLESNQALLISASSNNQVGVLLSGKYITS